RNRFADFSYLALDPSTSASWFHGQYGTTGDWQTWVAEIRPASVSGSTVPGAPQSFVASVSGTTLTLSWGIPATGGAPTEYVLQAALDPAFANLVYNQGTGS